jgi:hypothetical protein
MAEASGGMHGSRRRSAHCRSTCDGQWQPCSERGKLNSHHDSGPFPDLNKCTRAASCSDPLARYFTHHDIAFEPQHDTSTERDRSDRASPLRPKGI